MESPEKSQEARSSSKPAQPKRTGWASMPSTTAFRAINFELFVKPVSDV